MTKIKNTKKGMAKKTLSISLAVAMLATSNVPVWAAEFTDGTDAAFTSEAPAEEVVTDAEAPVVEEEVVADTEANADSIGADKLDVSGVTFTSKLGNEEKDAKGKEVVFGSTLTIGGSINKKTDGKKLESFSWGYRIKGSTAALVTGDTDDTKVTDSNYFKMNQNIWGDVWNQAVGKTVELYIFRKDTAAEFNNVVLGEFKVVPKEVGGTVTLTLDGEEAGTGIFKKDENENDYTISYTGKTYAYNADKDDKNSSLHIKELVRTDNTKITDLDKYDVSTTGSIQNAGDVMTICVTPKKDSGLTGEFVTNVTMVKRSGSTAKADEHLTAEVSEKLTYEYTGSEIDIPNDKIVVKEIKDKYADATLEGVVADAYTVNAANGIGEKTVTVALDQDAVKNFDISKNAFLTTAAALGHTVTITRRNLENVKVSFGYYDKEGVFQGKLDYIPEGLQAQYLYKYLVFTANDGTVLKLKNSTDYTITVKRNGTEIKPTETLDSQGTYSATVSAVEKGGNCVNSVSFDFTVGAPVSYAESQEEVEFDYSGEEYKPGKDVLKKIDVYGKVAGKDELEVVGTVDPNAYEIVDYKDNINAGTAVAVVKVTNGTFAGRTFDVRFTIKPLTISQETVTVPEVISYNKAYTTAGEYKVPLIVTAKNATGTIVKGLTDKDFTVSYKFIDGDDAAKNDDAKNEIHDLIQATVISANGNYVTDPATGLVLNKKTEIVAKALTDSMVKINPDSYTYTGEAIVPDYYVIDGVTVLYDEAEYKELGEYKFVRCDKNLNVGTATLVVEGVNDQYYGKASAKFEITPANTKDVKVKVKDQFYTGRQVRPRMSDIEVTLNGVDVTSQFELTDGFGKNIDGKGTLTLKPVATTKNFTGDNVVAEFNIVKEIVKGDLFAYDTNGVDVTTAFDQDVDGEDSVFKTAKTFNTSTEKAFDFNGTAKTFADVLLKNIEKVKGLVNDVPTKATAADFDIKYADNISGRNSKLTDTAGNHYNIGYVYAVGKEGSGFAGEDEIVLADGSKITGVVAKIPFAIKNVEFVEKNVTVTNGVYAGGLPVKPNVLIQIGGNTLVEGKDYELKLDGGLADNWYTESTNNKKLFQVKIIGKGGYEGSVVPAGDDKYIDWGIDQKDLKDCDVKVVNGVAYVMNGYIPVPTTEYTVKENDDKTYTVTANKDSKNYTGSKTVVAEGQKPTDKPETPMIQSVKVVGNKATVILSGETEGAVGYDYVISTDKDCINNKDYDKVNKNVLNTDTTFTYVQQDVYYAYCHAWKRGEDGKKIFSDWSNAYPFAVSSITPAQPGVTSVSVKGSTVTVKYTNAANADGYDVVLGSKIASVAGEKRPVEYGKLVKKNQKTTTVTFKNVKKGTYYVGLHAFNRTSEDGKKVFSPWSNVKKITVK